jgi:hypothetical protein
VDNPSPASSIRKRPVLDGRSRFLSRLGGVLCSVIILGFIFFPLITKSSWCPSSTFKYGLLPSATGFFIAGIPIATLSAIFLTVSLLMRYGLVRFTGASGPVPVGRYNTAMIISSVLGLLISGVIFCEGAAHYFCLSPESIVFQSGYPGRPRTLTWDNLTSVRAWCWTAKPRGGRSYQGSTLTLLFMDGKEIPFGLVDGGQFLMQDYEQIRKVLKGKNYDYYVNSSVNPNSCPPELYPLLWNWRRE